MRLGISSYTFPWSVGVGDIQPKKPLNALELTERAASQRVRVLQLADGLNLHALSARELDSIAEAAAKHSISLEVGTRATDRDALLPYLRIAQMLGSPLLRVVMRTATRQLTPEQTLALVREMLPEAERFGVCLGIETHESLSAAELRALLEAANSRYVGVVFDTANSLGRYETAEQVLETLADHIVNYHVKDVRTRRLGSGFGFVVEGTIAGAGDLDIAGLTRRVGALPIRKAVPEVNAILEHWPPFEDSIEATCLKEERWTAESLRFLRGLFDG
jgi:sugar phosphate isomerase/epimerase